MIEKAGLIGGAARVLETALLNPHDSIDQMAKKLGMTRDGVFYHIKNLRAIVGLQHIGPSKKGVWTLKSYNV